MRSGRRGGLARPSASKVSLLPLAAFQAAVQPGVRCARDLDPVLQTDGVTPVDASETSEISSERLCADEVPVTPPGPRHSQIPESDTGQTCSFQGTKGPAPAPIRELRQGIGSGSFTLFFAASWFLARRG